MANILFISHTGGIAGAETVLLDVIKTVSEKTMHRVFVVCPDDGDDRFMNALYGMRINGFKKMPYRNMRNTNLLFARNFLYGCSSLARLRKYCRRKKIDIIYSNSSVNIFGAIAAFTLGIKHIWHIHEQSSEDHRWTPRWFCGAYRKWFSHPLNTCIFVSERTRGMWEQDLQMKIENTRIVYSKYKVFPVRGESRSSLVTFGFAGSLVANKNVAMLIECFRRLGPGQTLLVAGDGTDREYLEQLARGAGVSFLGPVSDMHDFYGRIDVLVQPSMNESWGLSAIEAAGAGICTIITENSGLTEIFTSGEDCIFIDPSRTSSLMDAMRTVVNDPFYREAIATHGHRTLQRLELAAKFDKQIIQILNGEKEDFGLHADMQR